MRNEKIIVDFIRDRRAGISRDYSIPSETTFLQPDRIPSGRECRTSGEGCAIMR